MGSCSSKAIEPILLQNVPKSKWTDEAAPELRKRYERRKERGQMGKMRRTMIGSKRSKEMYPHHCIDQIASSRTGRTVSSVRSCSSG